MKPPRGSGIGNMEARAIRIRNRRSSLLESKGIVGSRAHRAIAARTITPRM
jgi:hypothetical protein